jgi:hypothetical protein
MVRNVKTKANLFIVDVHSSNSIELTLDFILFNLHFIFLNIFLNHNGNFVLFDFKVSKKVNQLNDKNISSLKNKLLSMVYHLLL